MAVGRPEFLQRLITICCYSSCLTEHDDLKEFTIKKRGGAIVEFDPSKISRAIYRAMEAKSCADTSVADHLAGCVVEKLMRQGFDPNHSPSVEMIQDMVEATLIEQDHSEIAKAYILYRHEQRKTRDDKLRILNAKSLDVVAKRFSPESLRVLASRYLLRNSKNEIIEEPSGMFLRVATLVTLGDVMHDDRVFAVDGGRKRDTGEAAAIRASLDDNDSMERKASIGGHSLNRFHLKALSDCYLSLAKAGHMRKSLGGILKMMDAGEFDMYVKNIHEYFELMASGDFLPNSPTMMNAGTRLGQLSACFVLDMPDNMRGIMKSTTDAAMIFQSGGGVGINYSDLRQEGDIVASTSGVASGPVSFMNIINSVTEVVKQGGKRRGANMGIMEVWHPDIEKFITAKTVPGVLENFNVSVGLWEDFWDALLGSDGRYMLRSPRDRSHVREVNAHGLIDMIAMSAWKSAEPGLIFFDNINRYNVFAKAREGPLRTTNPCGEQSLYPHESCNLGSINMANHTKIDQDGKNVVDWDKYQDTITKTIRFLDNIIDMNLYPIEEIDIASRESRRIGLGVMGVADLLYKLRLPYNSKDGYDMQDRLAEFLSYYSMFESVSLAKTRGMFPLCKNTEYPDGKIPIAGYYEKPHDAHRHDWDSLITDIKSHGIRNVIATTVAPTGTISMIAGCSNGMEPTFAIAYEKRVTVGKFFFGNSLAMKALEGLGMDNDEVLAKIAENGGSIVGIRGIPQWMQKVFVTAMDIHWADHLMAQRVWQMWIGNAIAKTINMPNDSQPEDVAAAYLLAHEMGLKGITIYRDGSRHKQVLHASGDGLSGGRAIEPSQAVMDYVHNSVTGRYVVDKISGPLGMNAVADKMTIEPAMASDQQQIVVEKQADVGTDGQNDETSDGDNCPKCKGRMVLTEGCSLCSECGYSHCAVG